METPLHHRSLWNFDSLQNLLIPFISMPLTIEDVTTIATDEGGVVVFFISIFIFISNLLLLQNLVALIKEISKTLEVIATLLLLIVILNPVFLSLKSLLLLNYTSQYSRKVGNFLSISIISNHFIYLLCFVFLGFKCKDFSIKYHCFRVNSLWQAY